MKELIKAALFTPTGSRGWGLPICVIDDPGTSKTSLIEAVASEYGIPCVTLAPGESGEGAFGVVPVPDRSKSGDLVLRYPAPEYVEHFAAAGGRGVLFVDEMNTAAPALQPALLGLVLAKRVGGHFLGTGVRTLGAANPVETAATGWDWGPAMANRMCHVRWQAPAYAAWSIWLLGFDPLLEIDAAADTISKPQKAADEEARVRALWPSAFAHAKALVASFLSANTQHLHALPKPSDPARSAGWPSRRSWTNAALSIASANVHVLDDDDRLELIRGFVGEGSATEFIAWEAEQNLPNPIDVLEERASLVHDPRRLDVTMAVLNSCASLVVTETPRNAQHVDSMWALLEAVTADAMAHDICVPIIQLLSRAKATPRAHNGKSTLAARVISRLKPALEAAGMV